MRPPVNFAEAKKMYPKYKVILDRIAQLAATDRALTDDESEELAALNVQDSQWRSRLLMDMGLSYNSKLIIMTFRELKIENDVSAFVEELSDYRVFCGKMTPSTKTHYAELEEWSGPVHEYIHEKLDLHGFINGGAARGLAQPPMADLWWNVYAMLSGIIHSPYLKTEVADHHSSAHSRNEALKKELEAIVKNIS